MKKLIHTIIIFSLLAFVIVLYTGCGGGGNGAGDGDGSSPTAELSNKPDKLTHETEINITVSGTDVVSYEYYLDDGEWSGEISIATPITVSGLSVGSHFILVIAKNNNGVWQTGATIYTWTIQELEDPIAVLSNKPDDPTKETDINITVGGTGVVSYKYDLDGGGWSGEILIVTPITASGLSVGSHTIQVIAKSDSDVWQAEASATIYTWIIYEWEDPTWTRRYPIVIYNTGSVLTDYQIKVELVYDTDMDLDFDDIRFTDSDGTTLLSHWREIYTPSTSAIFWVKVPSIPEAATTTIYMYYGNPAAADTSEGDATFLFFDDFEDGIIDNPAVGWTSAGGCTGVVIKDDGTGNKVLYDGTGGGDNVHAGVSTWTDIAVSQKFKSIDDTVNHAGIIIRFDGPDDKVYGGIVRDTEAEIWIRINGTWTRVGNWTIPDVGIDWHVQELRISGLTIELYIDGEFIGFGNVLSAPEDGEAGFWCQYGQEGYRDDHIVRKYVLDEPIYNIGEEEQWE